MKRLITGTLTRIVRALAYAAVGGLIVGIVVMVKVLNGRPDLQVWHSVELDEEFTADSDVASFAEYMALEGRLFEQLRTEVYGTLGDVDQREINRYHTGGLADPGRWDTNWNRSYELPHENPCAGVLLIHGMSDSPYSMRVLAERVQAAGAYALSMRVPGHGTAPSGLRDVEWEDMAAAVRLAARHASEQAQGAPLVLIGYSNGGALAVHYALEALADESLVMPARMLLMSPEIGITRLAALAIWQERIGHVLGLQKLAWNSILPEYDPFKYNSFALNAGIQARRITESIQALITKLEKQGAMGRFPRTLAFQSIVDATVEAPVLVSGFFDRLPGEGHELVLFDINRYAEIEPLMVLDPTGWTDRWLKGRDHSFTVEAVVNQNDSTEVVAVRRKLPGSDEIETVDRSGMSWPMNVYSLSHVALPFSPEDPVYGGPDAGESPGIQLGDIALRGERGVLQVSGTDMLRLRWNPFFDYMAERIVDAVLEAGPSGK